MAAAVSPAAAEIGRIEALVPPNNDVGPGWQLALVLAFIGMPMLCLPCIAAYYTAPTLPGGDIGLWAIAAFLCWSAASVHLPAETAHSLWARVLPRPNHHARDGRHAGMVPPRFRPNQWDSLLAPLVETALVSGALVGLPLSALLVVVELAYGSASTVLTAAAHLLLPQIAAAVAVVLLEAAALGGHRLVNAGARFAVWVACSCAAIAVSFRHSSALSSLWSELAASLERPGLSLYDCCMLALLCLQLYLLARMYQLLSYMHERTAAPATGEVLGEAVALLDMSTPGFSCRRTRPEVAAAAAAEQRARNAEVWARPWLLLPVAGAFLAAGWLAWW